MRRKRQARNWEEKETTDIINVSNWCFICKRNNIKSIVIKSDFTVPDSARFKHRLYYELVLLIVNSDFTNK